MSLPINLSVFIEIGDPTFGFTTGTELMQRLLEKKTSELKKDRNVGWSVQAPLYTMAEWMSDKQELSCPDSVLDAFDAAKALAVLGRSNRRCTRPAGFLSRKFF